MQNSLSKSEETRSERDWREPLFDEAYSKERKCFEGFGNALHEAIRLDRKICSQLP
jgi:hypothetical protein